MIIPAFQPVPIVADYSAPGLFIGLKAFDCITGSPVQISGFPGQTAGVWPMTNVAGSNSYLTMFTGTLQHSYLLLVQAYTDNTYTTVDTTNPEFPRSAIAKVMAPVLTQGIRVYAGGSESRVTVSQNSDATIILTFLDGNRCPMDITGAVSPMFNILEEDESTRMAKPCYFVDGSINQMMVPMLAADFALLPRGDNDANVTFSLAGQDYAFNIYNAISVQPDSSSSH